MMQKLSWMLLALLVLTGCGEDVLVTESTIDQAHGSWSIIQGQILAANCISCHIVGNSVAHQTGLILTADVAYSQLVDQPPKNPLALADGLMLVSSKGYEGLAKSFFWEKINAPNEDHFYSDHPEYGGIMPPRPTEPLTYGQLEYIRQWIIQGAPEKGIVADEKLLEKTDRYVPMAFVPLSKPTDGVQLHLEPFEVLPNYEREFFQFRELRNPAPVYIKRIEISMRPGSHHFILYTFKERIPERAKPIPNLDRDMRDKDGNYILQNLLQMRHHNFFTGTQWPQMDYQLPLGVAFELPANTGFDLNSHYVNRTNKPLRGEVFVNLHYQKRDAIEHIAKIIDFNHIDFELPPGQVTTLTKDFYFHEQAQVFQLFSHAHELMTEFRVSAIGGDRDGQEIYFTNDWEHPPIMSYNPPLKFEVGDGVRLTATYNNTRPHEVGFGFLSTDEMMILFGLYYND